jgi:hypothetical protein
MTLCSYCFICTTITNIYCHHGSNYETAEYFNVYNKFPPALPLHQQLTAYIHFVLCPASHAASFLRSALKISHMMDCAHQQCHTELGVSTNIYASCVKTFHLFIG